MGPALTLGAYSAIGSSEEYLKNGIKNLANNQPFNQSGGGAATRGAIQGLMDFGLHLDFIWQNQRVWVQETGKFLFGQGLSNLPGQGNQLGSSGGTNAVAAASIANVASANSTKPAASTSGGGGGAGNSSPTSSGGGSTTYTVRPGDTLGNIGYAHGTTATAIGAANGIQNLNLIRPGQVLNIPRRP